MSQAEPTPQRYARPPIDPEGRDSLAILSRWIEPRSEVLDIGTSTGALGRHLDERCCETDGVEIDPAAAEAARPSYRKLLEADLETADLRVLFEGSQYDAVVCADVLEHLRDPGRILEQARHLLKPGGALLVSVPNVGYAGVLLDLLAGEFNYRPLGILDATHLRFYTRPSLLQLLADHSFHPDKSEAVSLSLNESEFGSRAVERIPPRVLKTILEQPDALVYQFLIHATLNPSPRRLAIPAPKLPLACFTAQLFWRNGDAAYDEVQSVRATAPLDTEIHELRFQLPALLSDLATLRLDPSDRSGFVQLHSVAEESESGLRRWSWMAGEGPPPLRPIHQLVAIPDVAVPTFVALGEDPSFELTVPKGLQRVGSGALLVRVSLLPTAEALAATRGVQVAADRLGQLDERLAQLDGRLTQLDGRLAQLEGRLAQTEARQVEMDERRHFALLGVVEAGVGNLSSQMEGLRLALEAHMLRQRDVEVRVAGVVGMLERSSPRRVVRFLRRASQAAARRVRGLLGNVQSPGPGD